MIYELNETHDPSLKCSIHSANDATSDFPIQNLPFGIFRRSKANESPRVGVAIGNYIIDLNECRRRNLLDELPQPLLDACSGERLNALMALGPEQWSLLRKLVSRILRAERGAVRTSIQIEAALTPMNECTMMLPAHIGDYTDFYASIHHARNMGRMFRPDNPLLPNYKHVPIGYHGRSSSIVISGFQVRRPSGQSEGLDAIPNFGPSRMMDYECEIGAFVGPGNPLGEPIGIADAEASLFGLCLVNDWSARDIQKWEYQPLGPFLSKSFATSISPWVITMEALAPYRVPAMERGAEDPAPLPYLSSEDNSRNGGIAISLEASLSTELMRNGGIAPAVVSQGNLKDLYWTFAQLLTHHASNGCNLRSGDLIASGTVSGAEMNSGGCLIELTRRGAEPITLPSGEARAFLENGDEVLFRGRADRAGFASIGFGECRGMIVSRQAS